MKGSAIWKSSFTKIASAVMLVIIAWAIFAPSAYATGAGTALFSAALAIVFSVLMVSQRSKEEADPALYALVFLGLLIVLQPLHQVGAAILFGLFGSAVMAASGGLAYRDGLGREPQSSVINRGIKRGVIGACIIICIGLVYLAANWIGSHWFSIAVKLPPIEQKQGLIACDLLVLATWAITWVSYRHGARAAQQPVQA